ncbi:hypothetical protein RHECNPAF_13300127 [Rhizobium etli CNPAF512]|nr:hypothetical protein RHECNPAF_13300127 [Rhizobium etli CNPAF512]
MKMRIDDREVFHACGPSRDCRKGRRPEQPASAPPSWPAGTPVR